VGFESLNGQRKFDACRAEKSEQSGNLYIRDTGLFEVWTYCEDLMYEIFHRQDVILAESVLNDGIVGEGDTLAVDFAVAPLVDQLTDGLQVRLAEVTKPYNK
jgi:hypothetical protein